MLVELDSTCTIEELFSNGQFFFFKEKNIFKCFSGKGTGDVCCGLLRFISTIVVTG
jgi:hypothetical protein